MSSLNLTTISAMRPQRLSGKVPEHLIKTVGRQTMNLYRIINGKRSILDLARLLNKREEQVITMLTTWQHLGYVSVYIGDHLGMEYIPTVIIPHGTLDR